MNATQRFLVHLEMVIWESLPEGTALNAKQITDLVAKATPEQKQAAIKRAHTRSPLIFNEELDDIDLDANTKPQSEIFPSRK